MSYLETVVDAAVTQAKTEMGLTQIEFCVEHFDRAAEIALERLIREDRDKDGIYRDNLWQLKQGLREGGEVLEMFNWEIKYQGK
jgi:hypothetical protein